jgi:hypothetical protein
VDSGKESGEDSSCEELSDLEKNKRVIRIGRRLQEEAEERSPGVQNKK